MDSGGGGNRQETQVYKSNNMENANEPIEEIVPKILSSEIRDVFHIFTNILDLRSFLRLAMTSKEMYARCMEDKAIKINVTVIDIDAQKENGSLLFNESIDAVSLLPCKLNVDIVEIHQNFETADVIALHNYMKNVGVNIIYDLGIMCENVEWEAVIAMIKDFDVKSVDIFVPVADDILRSFLQLNLEKFRYTGPTPVDFVLEMESSVREITFANIRRIITKEQLMQITSRIQSGSLPQLNVHCRAIDWDAFEYDMLGLPLNNEEPLTEYRPLLLSTQPFAPQMYVPRDYWLLDRDGGVTKWITCGDSSLHEWDLQMFKCEPKDYPWILRKEEDVLKDLAEKHPRVSCSASQFHKFFESFPMIDRSQKELPADRPLCYKVNEHIYWLLDVDGTLMRCSLRKYVAVWTSFLSYEAELPLNELETSPLAKYVFCRLVLMTYEDHQFDLHCEGLNEFDRWFDGAQKLDFEYFGPLPNNSRPLVFWKSDRSRVVFFKDRLVMCQFFKNRVFLQLCKYFNRPPILFTAESVAEMLKDPYHHEESSIKMSLEMFHDGFKMFRRSPSVRHDRHLIWKHATDNDGRPIEEYWYKIDDLVRKVVWKEGCVILKEENDLRDAPPDFLKQIFRFFAENQTKDPNTSFKIELEQFHSFSEQFTVVPFEYSGPLIRDSPMAFVKNETRHIFHMGPTCQCSDSFIHVWFLWNGNRVTNCSWGRRKSNEVEFRGWTNEMPPALGNIGPPTDTSTPSSS